MRTITLTLVTVLLAAPLAAASFGMKGEWEPNTNLDRTGGYMRANPDTTSTTLPDRFVYFNAVPGMYIGYVGGVATLINPNVAGPNGMISSAHQAYPYVAYAILGAWKDCNRDGFVGIGEQGLWEYRVELLPDTTVCKSTVPPNPIPKNYRYPHNDGTWVKELIPIGWDRGAVTVGTPDFNPVNINDSEARVWADWGRPGDPPGGTCYVSPHERGTWHSAGGVTNYADCFASGRIRNTVNAAGLGGAYAALQAIQNPWGEESDASMAQMWDCSQPKLVNQKVGSAWVNVSRPRAPPTATGTGSPAGTANATGAGLDECERTARADGPSHAGATLATAPYATEGDVSNQPGPRHQSDQTLGFVEGNRPNPPWSVVSRTWPSDPSGTGANSFEGVWSGGSVTAASRNPLVTRQGGNYGPQPVTYTSYYAKLGATALTAYGLKLPSTNVGIYGSEACTSGIGAGKGAQNSWECDPANWWPARNGQPTMPRVGCCISGAADVDVGVRVGQAYQLRDIDCYDESFAAARSAGVSYGLLTATRCL